jgi:hypothetical protein
VQHGEPGRGDAVRGPGAPACGLGAGHGFHRNDLEWALGDQVGLSEDISATLIGAVPGLLPMFAAGSPVHGAVLLDTASEFRGEQWWGEGLGRVAPCV